MNEVLQAKEIFSHSQEYKNFLNNIKTKIRSSRLNAALSVNHELILLYWSIGNEIIERDKITKWGGKLLEVLSKDLRSAFPETAGFSRSNLHRMQQFASEYPNLQIVPQAVGQLPWGHISILIHKVKDKVERNWYIAQTIDNGWSRPTLERYINEALYTRQALKAIKTSNYLERLPHPQSELAHELLKQPYNFDFLGLHDEALEREIEHASISHIMKFLLELGKGFAFVGSQVELTLGKNQYFVDMLFYHLKLHCYVVIEIKAGKFKPEHAGKLNFYLNLVDDFYKTPEDKPTIGLLLCKSRDKFEAEYALKRISSPIGVSEFELTRAIPENMKLNLPSIEEIEAELNLLEDN